MEGAHGIATRAWSGVRRLVGTIFYVALFLICASAFGTGQKVILFAMVAMWIIFLLCVLVHESGHAIAAALVGWRTLIFAVRPLILNLLTWRLGLIDRSDERTADVGGWVLAVPRYPAAVTRWRYAIHVAGGPLANLLLAIATFWSAATWLTAYDRPTLSVSTLGGVVGYVSAFLAVFNLFPSGRDGLSSDGDLLRRLARRDAGWNAAIVVGSLAALIKYDARPRDRPRWMCDVWRTHEIAELRRGAAALDISAALDAPPVNATEVRGMITRYRADCGDSEWLSLCDAYLAAVWENDLARAVSMRWPGEREPEQEPLRLAVEAAIAAREGNRDGAELLLRKMRVAARAAPWMRAVFRDIDDQVSALLANGTAAPSPMLPKSLTR